MSERVRIANGIKEDAVLISLGFASGNVSEYGIASFVLSPRGVAGLDCALQESDFKDGVGNLNDSANIGLATAVHGSALRRLGTNTFDRGIQHCRDPLLAVVKHPAVLFRGGFMSHPREGLLISNLAYQDALANGIVDAVLKFRYAVSSNSTGEEKAGGGDSPSKIEEGNGGSGINSPDGVRLLDPGVAGPGGEAAPEPAPPPEPAPASGTGGMATEEVVKLMQDSVRSGQVEEFKFEQVLGWKAEGAEEIDGVSYSTGLAAYKAETIFGVKTIQAKALIKDGKVVKWIWPKSGLEIK